MKWFPAVVLLATIGAAALLQADGNRVLATYTLIVGLLATITVVVVIGRQP